MAKVKISEFNSNPALNTDIDGINIAENCPPSGINDAIRELMSQLKDFQTGAQGDSFNGPIGSTTASTGAFTTLTTTGNAGVGTSSPAARLHSTSSSNQLTISEGSSLGATFDYQSSTGNLSIATNGINARSSAQLVLNLNGNLGLGVTPSAWDSTFVGFQLGASSTSNGNASIYSQKNGGFSAGLMTNAYYNGGWKYVASSNAATRYEQNTGSTGYFAWYTAPSGTAGNAITFTQAMTLDASGNLALGSTSILGSTNRASFTNATSAKGVIALSNTSSSGYSAVELYDNSGSQQGAIGWGNGSVAVTGAQNATYLYSSGAITFLSGGTSERARITSGGDLLVGTTNMGTIGSTVGAGMSAGFVYAAASNDTCAIFSRRTGDGGVVSLRRDTTQVGTISVTASSTSYNTSSDYRLKNTIAPMTGALAKVAQLKPVTYKWNADGSDGEGFIAHELAQVVPQCVSGEKDAVDSEGNPEYQGIDTSFLVATLTSALQEAHGLIKNLETRISALEAK